MSRFRKSETREVPGLPTAALPDLIFSILFFFMIVTNMRPVPVKTRFDLPTATELQKMQEKSPVIYIMIGNESVSNIIQINSDFVALEDIPNHLNKIKEEISIADRNKIVVSLKADKDVPMGLINDIKENLRQTGMLTIHYSANKGM